MVCDALPPASIDPQLMEVMALVHPLSEYTPTFGPEAIVPEDVTFWLMVMAAKVVATSAHVTIVRITTRYFAFVAAMRLCSPLIRIVY